MTATLFQGAALRAQVVTPRTVYVQCGCSRRYTPAEFAQLEQRGEQVVEGEGTLLLANCGCGSTISMEAP